MAILGQEETKLRLDPEEDWPGHLIATDVVRVVRLDGGLTRSLCQLSRRLAAAKVNVHVLMLPPV